MKNFKLIKVMSLMVGLVGYGSIYAATASAGATEITAALKTLATTHNGKYADGKRHLATVGTRLGEMNVDTAACNGSKRSTIASHIIHWLIPAAKKAMPAVNTTDDQIKTYWSTQTDDLFTGIACPVIVDLVKTKGEALFLSYSKGITNFVTTQSGVVSRVWGSVKSCFAGIAGLFGVDMADTTALGGACTYNADATTADARNSASASDIAAVTAAMTTV